MTSTSMSARSAHVPQLTTNRRHLLAAMPAVAAAAVIAIPALASPDADAEISAAWKRWQTAFNEFDALPDDGDDEAETPYWAAIDAAEETIRSTVATTPRGAAIQLWICLAHSMNARIQHHAARNADLTALNAVDADLDWDERLILSALRSLNAMEA